MTDLLPETARTQRRGKQPERLPRDPNGNCTNDRHGRTRSAWQQGCRCPLPVAEHKKWLAAGGGAWKPAALDADGNCIARYHSATATAYRQAGCRCPGAIEGYQRELAVKRARRAVLRAMEDPRLRWRGKDDLVSRTNLVLLLSGFVDRPTAGERTAAMLRLIGTSNQWGTGIITSGEIARRIGASSLTAYEERVVRHRQERTQRRLADARWREVRRQRAIDAGRGHDRSGHPLHPLWVAAGYRALTASAPQSSGRQS